MIRYNGADPEQIAAAQEHWEQVNRTRTHLNTIMVPALEVDGVMQYQCPQPDCFYAISHRVYTAKGERIPDSSNLCCNGTHRWIENEHGDRTHFLGVLYGTDRASSEHWAKPVEPLQVEECYGFGIINPEAAEIIARNVAERLKHEAFRLEFLGKDFDNSGTPIPTYRFELGAKPVCERFDCRNRGILCDGCQVIGGKK